MDRLCETIHLAGAAEPPQTHSLRLYGQLYSQLSLSCLFEILRVDGDGVQATLRPLRFHYQFLRKKIILDLLHFV